MLERIIKLLPDYCEDAGSITEETSFADDIRMSSLDFVVFISSVEDEFGVKITDEEIRHILTIGDVVKCLEGK